MPPAFYKKEFLLCERRDNEESANLKYDEESIAYHFAAP